MARVIIHEEAIQEMAHNEHGPIGRLLTDIANVAIAKTRDNLNRQYPPSGSRGGYPARRTGTLRDSIKQETAFESDSIAIDLIAPAINRYDGQTYANILLERGFVFLTRDDLHSLDV